MNVLARRRKDESYFVRIEDESSYIVVFGVGDTEQRAKLDAARQWQKYWPNYRAVSLSVRVKFDPTKGTATENSGPTRKTKKDRR